MAEVIRMPKMSDTMTEGVIVSWLKNVGDAVKPGDILAEVETDKATMELENYIKGELLYIGIPAGGNVPVDALIAIIGQKGEDIESLKSASPNAAKVATPPNEVKSTASVEVAANVSSKIEPSDARIKASPLAKMLAQEKNIDLRNIAGSGDQGRIVKRDIENIQTSSNTAAVSSLAIGSESYEDVSLSQMRKTIARRLSESKFSAPHFYLSMEIRMDNVLAARKMINTSDGLKISVNDFVVKAVASALRKHPKINASWLGDKIRYYSHIHVGVAVAIDEGLIVPVVRFADSKNLSSLSSEIKSLADKAKNKKLQPNEFEGNTFTISNLGMFGIEAFTAIVNPPDACILAVGAVKETVIVENGEMKIGNVMKVTLSCDHRAVDGAIGSAFLKTLKDMLENPVKMMV